MTNFILAAIILVILVAAIRYIVKEKKRGVKCIGCPAAGECSMKNHGQSECSCQGHME